VKSRASRRFVRQAFTLSVCLLSLTSRAGAERLPIQTYTTANGLTDNTINKIVRDSRGFLWFCTEEGLSRFDGYEFVNFGTDQGLPHPYVNDLLETHDGDYWIATNAGLIHLNMRGEPTNHVTYANESAKGSPLFITFLPADPDRRARAITTLFEDHTGTIWIGTMKGLYCLERGSGRLVFKAVDIGIPSGYGEQEFVTSIVEDRTGSLWIATRNGLYRRWPDSSAARYTTRDGLPDNVLHHLLIDQEQRLWVSSRYAGFFRLSVAADHSPPRVAFRLAVHDYPQTEWTSQLIETSDKRFWAATARGLLEYLPDDQRKTAKYRVYSSKNGLTENSISAIAEDSGGNLWLGSGTGTGAMKLTRNGFVTYDEQDGIASVRSIFADRAGGVCFRGYVFGQLPGDIAAADKTSATYWPQFGRYEGQRVNWFAPDVLKEKNFGWVDENVTLQTRNGEWWIVMGDVLYRFPPTDNFADLQHARPLTVFGRESPIAGRQIWRVFEDGHERVWVSMINSSSNGLAYWDRQAQSWRDLTTERNLPSSHDDLARSFAEDRAGDVWIGFNTGVARFRDRGFTFFTSNDGLAAGAVQNIFLDHAGRLWLASSRGGLVRVDDPTADHPTFISYTTAQDLSSNSVTAVTEDSDGRIYATTGRGLDELNPETGRIRHFTTADGLASGALLTAYRDRTGALWFGTHRGLSRFQPVSGEAADPPSVLITGLELSGTKQLVSALGESDIQLPDSAANQNQLQVTFVGLNFMSGEVLRYQYKLEGADTDWSKPTEQRIVNYANLAPRRYKFLVRAINSHGEVSAMPAMIAFTILPPIWQRWWFVTLVVIAVAATIYWLYRYRMTRLLEITNMRTRIATDLHDDIGANLTRIALLSEVARQQADNPKRTVTETHAEGNGFDEGPLVSVGRIARESVGSMSDIVWAINPEHDSLLDLTRKMRQHADEVFTLRDIELELNAPDARDDLKLGADVRRDLLLIFKEAVNNAARHSRCTRVHIDFRIAAADLLLDVIDNGIGFNQSVESQGHGLRSMKRRAQALGGAVEMKSQPGQGTHVSLRMPVSRRRRAFRLRLPTSSSR
jgi:ligand-binding sensor domain-containing protein/signal transduction histidine kinase